LETTVATTLTPTTTLEAINQMLFAIGEAPVNRVEDNGLVDAAVALRTLVNVSREVQKDGWHWNTDECISISPDTDGNIKLPANTLKVDTAGADADVDVAWRGARLYDRANHTFAFTRPLTVDLVLMLDFEELPEAARNYIALRAARRFQQNSVGSAELSGFQQQDELRALVALQNHEAETADYRMLNNYDVARVLAR
jgi:hypothetical protein